MKFRKNRIIVFSVFTLVIVFMGLCPTVSAEMVTETYKISWDNWGNLRSQIDDGQVVWEGDIATIPFEIFLYDGEAIQRLTDDLADDSYPIIDD